MNGLLLVLVLLGPVAVIAEDRQWENPNFESAEASVSAARSRRALLGPDSSRAEQVFVDFNLAAEDEPRDRELAGVRRRVIDRFLLTYPVFVEQEPHTASTLEDFEEELVEHDRRLSRRMSRFGFPCPDGLVYLKLVDNVDRFRGFGPRSTDPMSAVGGLTLYCRYILLPLSYISAESLAELDRAAIQNPGLDRDGTLRQWQHKSFRTMVSTFRHEMVHVYTNTALGVEHYGHRGRFPTWFHEGTATYLSGDPHAGLSPTYQEYQSAFFYLVERFGVRCMVRFWSEGRDLGQAESALQSVFGIGDAEELFRRSAGWHRRKRVVRTAVWVLLGGIMLLALKGHRFPFKASFLLVLAGSSGYGTLSGLAERVNGLNGPLAVLLTRLVLAAIAIALAAAAVVALRRFRRQGRSS